MIFKIVIPDPKICFLFLCFSSLHLIVFTSQVKLYKIVSLIQLIKGFIDQRQGMLILDSQIVEILVINIQIKIAIGLFDKKDISIYGRFKGPNKIIN